MPETVTYRLPSGTVVTSSVEVRDKVLGFKFTPLAAAIMERPAGNASEQAWRDYRLAHGYSEYELEGLGRNDLRNLEDR